ncbi:glycosyltransferase [Streptacidiphilus sp. PB12-B1b]|uniref:glycosyltransferase n=1 Tax=Streptacidiphilus sp. PB12-B1b TaxID=2705012 RepID=UPI0015FDF403|nr:glycosyltransferase [Streptacidiphilus sp. PB12-B1b]QMU77481.1 glycosyltransferase [Streptacidiphilus sp. PB12-B1b]
MNGHDQRTDPACPCLVARESPYTPARVVELDLDDAGEPRSPLRPRPAGPDGRVLALVRLHGHPLGLVSATGVPGDPAGMRRALVDAAQHRLAEPIARHLAADALRQPAFPAAHGPHPCRARRAEVLADPPTISVVVATHNRVGTLRECLDSLLRTGYPGLEVIVVDNAPANDDAQALIRRQYQDRVRYLREPVAGLARAHNCGLAAAGGEITAFTDDDTVVDREWPAALAEAFAADPRTGCVTGLIVPAELETRTQADLQRHGGYDKGFTPRSWSLDRPPGDPLFPFTAGRFGSGANMAYRTDLLRRLGGFDPATGTGTPARGGDDLLGFFRALVAGATLAYRPDAVVWHRDRRTPQALVDQAFGYGTGLGAFLAAAVANEPDMLPALARRLPRGIHYAATRRRSAKAGAAAAGAEAGAGAGTGDGWSRRLTLLEVQGLLYGPVGYLRSLHRTRRLDHGHRPGPGPRQPEPVAS